MSEAKHYTKDFFNSIALDSFSSAKVILPIVNDVFKPSSVVDIGCGNGTWLKAWIDEFDVKDVLGVEGPYVQKESFQVPENYIILKDLKEKIELGRRFSLAMSLEVAEHLPESSAEGFVDLLTSLSDIVIFSAAIPGQEGIYHINEQLPEYWAAKFAKRGYVVVDYIRPMIWGEDSTVNWWYQQNIFIYIKKEKLPDYPVLQPAFHLTKPHSLLKVHPWLYFYKHNRLVQIKNMVGYLRWRLYPLKLYVRKKFKK